VAKTNYIKKGNDKKVLFTIDIGLANKHTAPFISWNKRGTHGAITMPGVFKDVRMSHIKPSNTHLIKEQKPRRTARGKVGVFVNTQARTKFLFGYLLNHKFCKTAGVTFIRREIKSLAEKAVAISKVRTYSTKLRWSGSAPGVCLCHTITDVLENKTVFIESFRFLILGCIFC
jgi:hypothetical protein